MILIGYAIWIGLTVFLCYRIAMAGGERSRTRDIVSWALGIALVLVPYWDVILAIPTMRSICSTEAGVQSKEALTFPLSSVEVVDPAGPRNQCRVCYLLLISGLARETYAYISFRPGSRALTSRSGVVRYWLVSSGEPACSAFGREYSVESRRSLWSSARGSYDATQCIASEQVVNSNAAFELRYPITTTMRKGVAVIRSRSVELVNADGSTAATLAYFQQLPWNGRLFAMYEVLPPVPDCPSFVRPITSNNFEPQLLLQLLAGYLPEEEVFR